MAKLSNTQVPDSNSLYGRMSGKITKALLYVQNKRDGLLQRRYRLRRWHDVLLYQGMLMNSKNTATVKLLIQCGILTRNQAENRLPKKYRKISDNIRVHYHRLSSSSEEAHAMALLDLVYNDEKVHQRILKHPLTGHNLNDPISKQIRQLNAHGYNYQGAKQKILHDTISGSDTNPEEYHHNFKYFRENPHTYKDTYPTKDRYNKYLNEAKNSKAPRKYRTVSGLCLEYQKKFGLSEDASASRLQHQIEHHLIGTDYQPVLKEFHSNRQLSHLRVPSRQNLRQHNNQKENKDPEL